ncbi:MAG: Na+/H+ antiporter subunit E [Wenzhouxiangella sp.]
MAEADIQARPLTVGARLIWGAQTFVVLMLTWTALNGLDGWWLALVASCADALLGGALASHLPHPWKPHRLIYFGGFFLIESFRGGFDVARRALHPTLQIDPCFTRHPVNLPAGQPRTLLVSILSLLPGTLSADLEDDGATLVVHALFPEASRSIGVLEDQIAWLFSLEHDRS